MGSLENQKLRGFHDAIHQAIYWSSRPDWQKACEILNGMSMDDMLDELWRIKGTGQLDFLVQFAPRASGVNVPRLRVAIAVMQPAPPADFDALLRSLPLDQQLSIKKARAVTQAPNPLNPALWSKYYWLVRTLPAPQGTGPGGSDQGDSAARKADDDAAHLAADIASALTANTPRGSSPATYTVTVVYRNLDAVKFGKGGNNEVAVLHEPNVSVQISPDPNSKAVYQAAISLINLHMKRNWGLISPDVEVSIGAQGGVTNPGATPGGGLQAQVEVHVTTTISIVASSSVGVAPGAKPGGPPDYGSFHAGNKDVDVAFTPFILGIVGHWDPP